VKSENPVANPETMIVNRGRRRHNRAVLGGLARRSRTVGPHTHCLRGNCMGTDRFRCHLVRGGLDNGVVRSRGEPLPPAVRTSQTRGREGPTFFLRLLVSRHPAPPNTIRFFGTNHARNYLFGVPGGGRSPLRRLWRRGIILVIAFREWISATGTSRSRWPQGFKCWAQSLAPDYCPVLRPCGPVP
jgi:hypothetical protein